MSFLGIGGHSSAPPAPAPVAAAPTPLVIPAPTKTDAEVQGAADAFRNRLAAAGGRNSTILTGWQDNEQQPAQQKTLLGAA